MREARDEASPQERKLGQTGRSEYEKEKGISDEPIKVVLIV